MLGRPRRIWAPRGHVGDVADCGRCTEACSATEEPERLTLLRPGNTASADCGSGVLTRRHLRESPGDGSAPSLDSPRRFHCLGSGLFKILGSPKSAPLVPVCAPSRRDARPQCFPSALASARTGGQAPIPGPRVLGRCAGVCTISPRNWMRGGRKDVTGFQECAFRAE
jgi:hypothetical protein